ncbi:hypothetical protein [Pimelobacter simplex]|uniref:hypothetical protein n=1 Tax=Nocardioides simplex TaxID=2045 RepID=UPI00214F9981|nr:hypothetical protein [Pimelobacter simplex]UUW88374.1 hypothetical protein M0M43_21880 [Pimelobacter simplex]UUW97878.1 hypothetical protein M0M48_10525 [Pimelobacter simplex]
MTASTDLDDTLANIRARAEAATPGPWEARHGGYSWVALYADEDKIPQGDSLPSFEPGGSATPADAEFIAHARADVELLLNVVAEQRAVIARVREAIDREHARGCHYRHQQGETDECRSCAATAIEAAFDGADTTTTDGSEA